MKVFIIESKLNETFVVRNKNKFCKKMGLTPRLLDYTVLGASSTRYQEWHKGFKITNKFEFIESKGGDRVLWDNPSVRGYCVRYENKKIKNKKQEDINIVEIESLRTEIEKVRLELDKALRQKQNLQDRLNVYSRINREQYRFENMCDLLTHACKSIIKRDVDLFEPYIDTTTSEASAILTLSDLHFGQIVNETNNYFDSEIANIRLGKIFSMFEKEVDLRGIKDVHIMFLGDLIHAQSVTTKPDMKLSGEFPEVQSTIHCFRILSIYIDRLVQKYNVSFSGVLGNESRFSNHILPSNLQKEAKNNMDVIIFEMIFQRYRHLPNVCFKNACDELESVVEVNGKQFLLTHGNSKGINHKELDKSLINARTRLSPIYGEIDYVVLGHIHSAYIADKFARNSSLVGSNAYSNELGIVESTVSQNMIIVDDKITAFSLKP